MKKTKNKLTFWLW